MSDKHFNLNMSAYLAFRISQDQKLEVMIFKSDFSAINFNHKKNMLLATLYLYLLFCVYLFLIQGVTRMSVVLVLSG